MFQLKWRGSVIEKVAVCVAYQCKSIDRVWYGTHLESPLAQHLVAVVRSNHVLLGTEANCTGIPVPSALPNLEFVGPCVF